MVMSNGKVNNICIFFTFVLQRLNGDKCFALQVKPTMMFTTSCKESKGN